MQPDREADATLLGDAAAEYMEPLSEEDLVALKAALEDCKRPGSLATVPAPVAADARLDGALKTFRLIGEVLNKIAEVDLVSTYESLPEIILARLLLRIIPRWRAIDTLVLMMADMARLNDLDEEAVSALEKASQGALSDFRLLLVILQQVIPEAPKAAQRELIVLVNLARERLAAQEAQEAQELVGEAEAARDVAVRASVAAERAAGKTGADGLADHFRGYARRELLNANILRVISSILLLVISTVAALIFFGHEVSGDTLEHELAKLATTVPLAVLAGYLGREASRHRSAANWSRQLEVQLKTVDAFIAPLPAAEQERQRVELGRRVFGTCETDAGTSENAPAVISEASNLLASIASLIRPATK